MTDNLIFWLPLASLIGAYISAVAGMGGGLVILGACTFLLPIQAAVPVSGVLVMAGQVARTGQFYHHINWSITKPFIPGSFVGAVLGSFIYFSLPELVIAFMLATVMLWFIWLPPKQLGKSLANKIPHPYFWVGIIHTFISTIAGVGGLFQSLMVNSSMRKEQIVATIAGTLISMSAFKTIGYMVAGFNYMPYLLMIILCWIVGILGSRLGKKTLNNVSDEFFRKLIKGMVTVFSLRLYFGVIQALLNS